MIIGIIILGFIFGCQSPSNNQNIDNSFDSVIKRRGDYISRVDSGLVPNFNKYFDNNHVNGIDLQIIKIGKLKLSSGRLIACDPFYAGETFTLPFDLNLPIGDYDVDLCIADLKNWGKRVAFSRLLISLNKTTKWDLISLIKTNNGNDSFYGVDAGLGCFMDSITAVSLANEINSFYKISPDGNYYEDKMAKDFDESDNWANHFPKTDSDLNCIIFSSGLGDGIYSSYVGYDKNNNITCVVTDFQLFDETESIVK